MRVLLVHNQLWAHYKSVLFEEISRDMKERFPESSFLVAQIALFEKSRMGMSASVDDEEIGYDYPYQVLFETSLDSLSTSQRLKALFTVFHSYRPTVLNITGYFDLAQIALMLYAKFSGVKVIISAESSQQDKVRSIGKEGLKKVLLSQADAFFCFGKTTVDYLKSLGIPIKKIPVTQAAVVDNGRIRQVYEEAKKNKGTCSPPNHHFIYVGRLAVEKNLVGLIEAFRRCLSYSQAEEWGLLLVGTGPQEAELKELVSRHKLTHKVQFMGGVAWYKVPTFLAKADVLILPSFSEPWGLVVNEAMVCGMPVLVSNRCGCAEDLVKEGENGFTFDPANGDALIEGMRYYMQNPEKIELHGISSKECISGFSPKPVARQMVDVYRKLSSK